MKFESFWFALVYIPKQKRQKWDYKSDERVFIGYAEDTKGYRVMNPIRKKNDVSRDVIFKESTFYKGEGNRGQDWIQIPMGTRTVVETPNQVGDNGEICPLGRNQEQLNAEESFSSAFGDDNEVGDDQASFGDECSAENDQIGIETSAEQPQKIQQMQIITASPKEQVPLRCSERLRNKQNAACVIGTTEEDDDPLTVEEALSRPEKKFWLEAMESELNSLEENKTWVLVDLPVGI